MGMTVCEMNMSSIRILGEFVQLFIMVIGAMVDRGADDRGAICVTELQVGETGRSRALVQEGLIAAVIAGSSRLLPVTTYCR